MGTGRLSGSHIGWAERGCMREGIDIGLALSVILPCIVDAHVYGSHIYTCSTISTTWSRIHRIYCYFFFLLFFWFLEGRVPSRYIPPVVLRDLLRRIAPAVSHSTKLRSETNSKPFRKSNQRPRAYSPTPPLRRTTTQFPSSRSRRCQTRGIRCGRRPNKGANTSSAGVSFHIVLL